MGRFDQFRLEEQESYLESIPLLFYGLADCPLQSIGSAEDPILYALPFG